MKSTDKATRGMAGIVRPENPLSHVRRYVSQELAHYPIYQKLIDDANNELADLQERLTNCTSKINTIGGGHSGPGDPVGEATVQANALQSKIKNYYWRIEQTEFGLNYFKNDQEIMKLIKLKFFTANNWTTEELMERLGYKSTQRNRYYNNFNKIIDFFGRLYRVLP
jgi:hypothetical protein